MLHPLPISYYFVELCASSGAFDLLDVSADANKITGSPITPCLFLISKLKDHFLLHDIGVG